MKPWRGVCPDPLGREVKTEGKKVFSIDIICYVRIVILYPPTQKTTAFGRG
jgi:hypothetical protein